MILLISRKLSGRAQNRGRFRVESGPCCIFRDARCWSEVYPCFRGVSSEYWGTRTVFAGYPQCVLESTWRVLAACFVRSLQHVSTFFSGCFRSARSCLPASPQYGFGIYGTYFCGSLILGLPATQFWGSPLKGASDYRCVFNWF